MKLTLYNSLTRQVEPFEPTDPDHVTMYTCGPTVYGPAHIGNLRTYTLSDVLYRTLCLLEYEVEHVMNITDVGHLVSDADEGEDKMAKGVRQEGMSSMWELANKYISIFLDDSEKLHLLPPHVVARATEHIDEQIALIQELEAKGFTYQTSDGVYFDTSKLDNYGELSDLDFDHLQEGARVEKNPEKKNSTDFSLWKFHQGDGKREMEWESPWGVGFPGWHIECSAMSLKYLSHAFSNGHIDTSKAQTIDIHIGGEDLKMTHHPNEIAQSEACTGIQFVKYWLHGAFLLINDKKISKSKNNYVVMQDIVDKGIDPVALRYFYLTAHYRKQTNFTWEALKSAQNAVYKLYALMAKLTEPPTYPNEEAMEQFKTNLVDDLGTPEALATVWMVVDADMSEPEKLATLFTMDSVLGFDLRDKWVEYQNVPETVKVRVSEREQLRSDKKYEQADAIRDELGEQGYTIEDSPAGPVVVKMSG